MLSFASLCTGEGLMDVGAKLAGFELAWGLEIAASHAAVARLNLGHKIHVQSIVDFDWHKVDRVDHLHISPPCTRASQANSTVGESDLDLAIARSFCDALEILMPLSIS